MEDSRVKPAAQNDSAVIWAYGEGYTEIVKLLFTDKRVVAKRRRGSLADPPSERMVRLPSLGGYLKIVDMLSNTRT